MKDKCVSCNVETKYSKHDHIDYRLGYVSGAGQLCLECYDKIYIKKETSYAKNHKSSLRRSS